MLHVCRRRLRNGLEQGGTPGDAAVGMVTDFDCWHPHPCRLGCQTALDHALITAPEARAPAVLERLDAVAGRALKRSWRILRIISALAGSSPQYVG